MIILPLGLTFQEIRVLQEFKRLNAETLGLPAIQAIKHPAGGGEAAMVSLVEKGYLRADGGPESFALTDLGKDFLTIQAVPEGESPVDVTDTPVE